jgi:hypothetical protein
MYQIKQGSTAYPLLFLMVDETDHVTGKTGLSPTVTIRKPGGSFAAPAGAVTEIGNGWYQVAGNATDTDTMGPLALHATATGADPADVLYEVVANVEADTFTRMGAPAGASIAADLATVAGYLDTEIAAIKAKTDLLPADPADASDIPSPATIADAVWDEPRSGHTAAGSFGEVMQVPDSGTAQGGGSNTLTLRSGASAVDDFYNGGLVFIVGGTGAGQANVVDDYVGATKVATVARTWKIQPDGTSVYVIYPGAAGVTVAQIVAGVWDAATSSHQTPGTFGKAVQDLETTLGTPAGASVSADVAAVKGDSGTLVSRLTAPRATNLDNLDTAVSTRATASALATAQADLTSVLAIVNAVAGFVDTEVAAIKAKTDQLAFTGGRLNAALDATERQAIADALLVRNQNGGSDGGRTLGRVAKFINNRKVRSGNTITVYEDDGVTEAFAIALTTDATVAPVVSLTP